MTIPEAIEELRLVDEGSVSDDTPRAIRLAVAALRILGAMGEQLGKDLLRELDR